MPKILGNRSGKNNKSCRIFHNKFNKIGFAFSDFSTILYEFSKFSKSRLLFKTRFYRQVPVTSVSIAKRFLVHEKHPGIKEREAMWSLGMEGGAARRNWAIPVGNLAGEGVEKEEGRTTDRFVASEGWGTPVAGRSTVPSEPVRDAPRSGGSSV
jgi:hypothetical protein